MLIGTTIRTKDKPAQREALLGTCAQLPPKSGAVHVDAVDAVDAAAQVMVPTASGI